MSEKKRVLVCEFHQESNTFNPVVARHDYFLNPETPIYGKDLYGICRNGVGRKFGRLKLRHKPIPEMNLAHSPPAQHKPVPADRIHRHQKQWYRKY